MISEAVVRLQDAEVPEIRFIQSNSSSGYFYFVTFDLETHSFNINNILDDIKASLGIRHPKISDAFLAMLASEEVLVREWLTPEEDEAWKDL